MGSIFFLLAERDCPEPQHVRQPQITEFCVLLLKPGRCGWDSRVPKLPHYPVHCGLRVVASNPVSVLNCS
jgi:hypothetical protein